MTISNKKPGLLPEVISSQTPVIAAGNQAWRTRFLERLAETSNVSEAARKARINPSTAYRLRREDPHFRQEWQLALLEGYQHLEMETLHRLRMGTDKEDRKFDFANALRLLSLHRENVAQTGKVEKQDNQETVLATLNAKIDAMRENKGK